jgi:hypothetical protein
MKKRKPRARPKVVPCQCNNPKSSITSLFTEVFEEEAKQEDQEEFHAALNHSPAFNFMVEASMDEETSMCCLLADAVRFGWKAGRREQECKKLEEMVGYGK